ncbi:glucosamine-6-phosphate deaminase [Chryseolinea sp. T2]|uniref:6-phosphogluconolactonase n=1 Tax=Chryseolinea sp. T2 TaxID=3129255 RepID=UPI0030787E56
MNLRILSDYSTLSRTTADLIATYLKAKPKSIICLASGHSPRGVFEYLVSDVVSKRLTLDECTFVSLDEWLGIPASQAGSCRDMMDKDLFKPLGIPPSRIVFFNGMAADPQREVDVINEVIDRAGGLDIMLVGVGTNGHIAMNEPGTPFDIRAHISTLTEETQRVGQKYFEKNTALSQGLTLGLGHFREAKLPILIAAGQTKQSIMKRVLTSAPAEHLPASVVHLMPGAYVMLDREAFQLDN